LRRPQLGDVTKQLCDGHEVIAKSLRHEAAADKATATFEGESYTLSECPTEFILIGPLPATNTRMKINPLSGEYTVTKDIDGRINMTEWSGPQD